ncbi:hypothetical protein M422DRAFT_778518 [Sphaerobolus stellatus SS14]|uniref:Uncharacterized protein n=1 Tax=Sphaerobolus stellatus (strain SS14) TaxID=990650 RepID=A0A0C9VU80_SPHS4|nr:hypothetical protein M422DRAFT_778518 [Sphaerobolus stellatus SS14]
MSYNFDSGSQDWNNDVDGSSNHNNTNTSLPQPGSGGPTLGSMPDVAEFADGVANIRDLHANQRDDLLALGALISDLQPSEVRRTIYQEASIQQIANQVNELRESVGKLFEAIGVMDAHFKANFALTDYHKTLTRLMARKYLIEPKRTNFDYAPEVINYMKTNKTMLRIDYIFENPVFEDIFITDVGKKCSDAHSALKKLGEDSVLMAKSMSLTEFTENVAEKFMESSMMEATGPSYVLWWCLFRRYTREYYEIKDEEQRVALGLPRKVKSPPKRVGGKATGMTPAASPATTAITLAVMDLSQPATKSMENEYFWPGFTSWILVKQKAWGKNTQVGEWVSYMDQSISWERQRWPADKIAAIPTIPATSTFNPALPYNQMPPMPQPSTPQPNRDGTSSAYNQNTAPQTPMAQQASPQTSSQAQTPAATQQLATAGRLRDILNRRQ